MKPLQEDGRPPIGKVWGLQRLANQQGVFCICAIDHQDDFRELVNPDISQVSYQTTVRAKLEVIEALSPMVSAFLLDPVYSLGQAILGGSVPGSVGLIASLEEIGYGGTDFARETILRKDWSVSKAKRIGVDGLKLLLFYRPDSGKLAERQKNLVEGLADECRRYDMPLIVEPIWYPSEDEDIRSEAVQNLRVDSIIRSAEEIADLGVDLMKVEFPGSVESDRAHRAAEEACQRLSESIRVPWVVLSGGVDFSTFKQQVEIACRSGASGFLAGRAIWREAVEVKDTDTRRSALEEARSRLSELAEVTTHYGRPWFRAPSLEDLVATMPDGWYGAYEPLP
jgi:tagatose 1,6-diphosphate aldolase